MTLFDDRPNVAEHPMNTIFERTEDGIKIVKKTGSGGTLWEFEYSQDQWDDIVLKMGAPWQLVEPVPAPEPEPEPERAPRAPTPEPEPVDTTDPAPRAPRPSAPPAPDPSTDPGRRQGRRGANAS